MLDAKGGVMPRGDGQRVGWTAIWLLVASPIFAGGFPPVTDKERALKAVAGEPNAPAAVLFRKAELQMADLAEEDAVSSLVVTSRTKVLTEAGKEFGEVAIGHSGLVRLVAFEGRTILPDGRIVPVPKEAKFQRKLSRSQNRLVTTIAFPNVEVGSILDYRYELRFESIYWLEPWFFSERIPVLYSEIAYLMPAALQARAWSRDPLDVGVKTESSTDRRGSRFRAWVENAPSVPQEPHSLPLQNFAVQFMLVPTAYVNAYVNVRLLDTWPSVCAALDKSYDRARKKAGPVVAKAHAIPPAVGRGQKAQATALFGFVRDEIATEGEEGVYLRKGATLESVLARRSGDPTEKALLLEAMLRAVSIDTRLVWALPRDRGLLNEQLPNPSSFDRCLVRATVDGETVYLDPSERALGFGRLAASLEGTRALVVDTKKPEWVLLPETPFERNQRRATLDLAADRQGRITGQGNLLLAGHHAQADMDPTRDSRKAAESWRERLAKSFPGFDVSGVKVAESPEAQQVNVVWSLRQRDEDVLGNEARLAPSRPLGPLAQPFVLPVAQRRSPVLLEFADRSEVELRLRWAEGFKVDAAPRPVQRRSAVGEFEAAVTVDPAARSLTYTRRLDMTRKLTESREQYELMRALYGEAEKSDAQALVLLRR